MFDPKVRYVPIYSPTAELIHGSVPRQPNESVCASSRQRPATLHPLPGDNSCVEPPDPIPNSEVKRARADGSLHLACESRSSPGFYPKTPQPRLRGFSLCPGFRQGVLALLRPCASVNVCVLQTTVTSMRCSASILISAACLLLLPVANAAELPRVDVQGATG